MSGTALAFAAMASLAGALAAVFQSRGARGLAPPPPNIVRLLLGLALRPIWLVGLAFAGVSGVLHAVALRHGSLIEVESIMVTSLLFALALGIVVSDARVSPRDWLGALATILGLVCFLGFADPQDGDYDVPVRTWIVAAVVLVGVISALVVAASRARSPNVRAALWGTTAAVFLKTIDVGLNHHDPVTAFIPVLLFLGLCEIGALTTQQLAFRAGDLAPALAPFVGGNPIVAGAVAIALFGERFHHAPADLLGACGGIALVVAGIVILASSPLVAAGTGEARRPARQP
jgi:drug/metabolite transporter (DMT)-like permease